MKFLYGATVDGIQSYIFQTGKLKEIVGGSELVEQICNEKFQEVLGEENYNSNNAIVKAAGKIIYLFEDQSICKNFVRDFYKNIKSDAPNIQLSQAVVELSDNKSFKDCLDDLNGKLEMQKNKKPRIHGLGLMISERSRLTGGAGVDRIKEERGTQRTEVVIDQEQAHKLKIVKNETSNLKSNSLFQKLLQGKDFKLPLDINEIAPPEEKSGLAIIHADGNSLGQTIESIYKELPENKASEMDKVLKEFSEQINISTVDAAKSALDYILQQHPRLTENKTLPLRPIILGGDDLTIIIRGDLAIDFINSFLQNFQKNTKENFQHLMETYDLRLLKNGLTACAGISFVKPNYPFHYGVNLSEELCKHSKNIAKAIAKNKKSNQVPSCLTFHKVQSSFVEDFDNIISRELKAKDILFKYGPYFIEAQEDYSTVEDLQNWVKKVNSIDAPKSGLRKWLAELQTNPANANQLMERIKNLNKNYSEQLELKDHIRIRKIGEEKVTHIFDMLTLASIQGN